MAVIWHKTDTAGSVFYPRRKKEKQERLENESVLLGQADLMAKYGNENGARRAPFLHIDS